MLAQATGRSPAWLDDILEAMGEHLNEKGYFGKICAPGAANEQQLAGHSWVLRGLIEYYQWKKDERILQRIKTIVENLLLPAKKNYRVYPHTPELMAADTCWELSHPQSKTRSHAKSIDTACGFIMLDGATHAFELLKTPELQELVEVMIAKFMEIDLVAYKAQTHATLTALRGILRFYENTGEAKHLQFARTVFDRYKRQAWTEHYGNYNWWGVPRWTEACAVIDSFIVATWLWKLTGEAEYLEDAHHVFYNAAAHATRASGCWGTDYCLGADLGPHEPDNDHDQAFLTPRTHEVYWCCTMRGGEFFARAFESILFAEDNTLLLPFYHNCTATIPLAGGAVKIRESTGYPYDGEVRLEVLESAATADAEIKFFLPSWRGEKPVTFSRNGEAIASKEENGFLVVRAPLVAGDVLSLDFGIRFCVAERVNESSAVGAYTFRHGAMILCRQNEKTPEGDTQPQHQRIELARDTEFEYLGKGAYRAKVMDVVLAPMYRIDHLAQAGDHRQTLFGNK